MPKNGQQTPAGYDLQSLARYEGMIRLIMDSYRVPEKDAAWIFNLAKIDSYIKNGDTLSYQAGITEENFFLVADALTNHMRGGNGVPLHWDDPDQGDHPGRRCLLIPEQMLLVYLYHKRHNMPQDLVATFYGISQSSVSRYCDYVEEILERILPTADNLADRIRKARTVKQMQKAGADEVAVLEEAAGREPTLAAKVGNIFPRNTLMHDGTHIPKERAVDAVQRKADSSGKKKTTTNNAVITINANGVILGMSDYVPGSTHDLTLMRDSSPDLGLITRCMVGESEVIIVHEYVDGGFQGIQDDHPNAVVHIPERKKRSRPLDESQKRHNRRVGSTRAKVENVIRRCKTFGCLRHRIRRIKSKARRTLCVITGFVNLHLLTRSYDTANNHRKTKKPGPKTPRNRG